MHVNIHVNIYMSLQWRSDSVEWTTLNNVDGGFSHSERLLVLVTSENVAPTLSLPYTTIGVDEDAGRDGSGVSSLAINGVRHMRELKSKAIFSILVYWCSVSCFMWTGALDLQLWCSFIITCNITSIAHNHYTNIYSQTYTFITYTYIGHNC